MYLGSYYDENKGLEIYYRRENLLGISADYGIDIDYCNDIVLNICWSNCNKIEYICHLHGTDCILETNRYKECISECSPCHDCYKMDSDNYRYLYVNNKLVKIELLTKSIIVS